MINKMLLVVAIIVLLPSNLYAEERINPNYDADRAATAGADQYGMKRYVMAFLKRGPNRDRTDEEAKALQAAHMANIGRLAEAGKLVLAGPFLADGELRGIYIFNVTSIEEAKALTASDPAVQAGSLIMELKAWYGSAALTEMNGLHKLMSKTTM
ncbi:YciI family protein [Shewanella abyssi]|uniref:YciI family protein n=1 Tax=Shewanella abyssi TaxID=311789 RepID=UPI00200CECCF|nr:YciI family protein [Shewanella abyssi]MCL1050492.1 YciI family protein [Shewanella abyssi]